MNSRNITPLERRSLTRLSRFRKTAGDSLTRLIVQPLSKTPIPPNAITLFGFLLALGAGALIITSHFFAAGFVVLLGGLFDMLDGALARRTGRVTRLGAVLDSTLDRLAEGVLLLSILVTYAKGQSTLGVIVVGVALLGSVLVSYIRARAEAIGLDCEVGLFTRAERVVVLALGLLFSQIDYALIVALGIIAVFSFVTAGQRLIHVWQKTKS